MPNFPVTLLTAFVVASVCAWLIFAGMAHLTGGNVGIWPDRAASLPPNRLFDLTRSTVTAAGLLAGVFAIVYAYRKQKIEEAGSFRADADSLGVRYQSAAELLGNESSAARLAGVYSLSRLADEDSTQRETICRLLCGYLRMSYDPVSSPPGEREVRHAIIGVISEHLQDPAAPTSWCGFRLDFSGATFDGGSFSDSHFINTCVDFSGSRFVAGTTHFDGCTFEDVELDFGDGESDPAIFDGGRLHFIGAQFKVGARVNFVFARFVSGSLVFGASEFLSGSSMNFSSAELDGVSIGFGGPVWLGANFRGGYVGFDGAKLKSGLLSFMGVRFLGAELSLNSLRQTGGMVLFDQASFEAGSVTLDEADLYRDGVSFEEASNPQGTVSPWPIPLTGNRRGSTKRRIAGRRPRSERRSPRG
ncbi:uncharacterized protein YjbI with pentapeptide repeats [Streptomyces sp. PvR006]|uniref:pentapeptide repeat-containing protein n=1 Tax=Streptomyces sp. PvR006 TaxID=2817860 RepID=UPI001AE1DE99|nr:pentapeptide repeat-containing protein [Streptomyces sp. PvR006]MBP2581831.1 uncharacterized protein YjbI with pentapeptide repeats [Streptomyces sp. PvR006]